VIVLDTNVLSELLRPQPDRAVVAWVARQQRALFTTAISEAELLFGVALIKDRQRQDALAQAVERLFEHHFSERVLSFDPAAAGAYARIASRRRQIGRPIQSFDAAIAAIVSAHGASLATRDLHDFEGCGIDLKDPWSA
jgi:toxin FitB